MTLITTRSAVAAVVALAQHPELWLTALRQLFRIAPRGWWKKFPPLPLPDKRYLAFRAETAYGDPEAVMNATDIVTYLQWVRRQNHMAR